MNEPSIDSQTNILKGAYHQSPESCDPKSIGVDTCGHNFHIDCIKIWLFEHISCPLYTGYWKYCKTILLKIRDV